MAFARDARIGVAHMGQRRVAAVASEQIIEALPAEAAWPPLTRGMFTPSGDDPLLGGYKGRIIHVGGRYNGIWDSFDEWRIKYEALLRRLYLELSRVYFDTAFRGHLMYQWSDLVEATFRYRDDTPPPVPDDLESFGLFKPPRVKVPWPPNAAPQWARSTVAPATGSLEPL
jgi:hypothetical protein